MAALFVSFAVAAQTTDSVGRIIINSAEEFLKIGTTGYPIDTNTSYIQTANIDLGNMDTLDAAIIKLFRGTYDGGGHSISYSATFRGKKHRDEGGYNCGNHGDGNGNYDGDYGLFGFLQGGVEHGGVIKNLNLSGEILIIPTPGDKCDNMNYALLCGHAFCNSTIDHCNVSGTVNSQVEGQKGGGDAGLLVGQADGATIQYCTGSGNVSSIGWVGGLIGSGGHNDSITIKACTFSGSVQASRAKSNTAKPEELEKGYGGFAGGIIGFAGKHGLNNWQSVEPSVSIDLCYVNANITATNVVSGIASVAMGAGTATVKNSCAEGSITKTEQNGETDTTTNSTTHTVQSNTYDSNDKTVDELERIVEALNRGRAPGEKAEFDVVNGQIVLYLNGKPAEPCAAVTGLTISSVTPGSLTCSWTKGGSETEWSVSISGGNLTEDITVTATTNTNFTITNESLTTSQNNYVLSVVAVCGDDRPNSTAATSSFVISCPTIAGMSVTPAYTSATVTWTNTETVEAKLYQGGTLKEEQTITSAQEQECTFSSLTPNTAYKVKLSAACGDSYGEATERVFTTLSLPIVENVQIAARFEDGGSVAITWDYALAGATYQVEVKTSGGSPVDNQTELTTKSYNKSSIAVGSYQARIKATYQGHEAGWTEWFPFVISDPNAPKNVHWSDTAIVNSQYQLTLAWTRGNEVTIQGNSGQGWEITADPNSEAAYTITANSGTSNYSKVLSNDNHYVTPGSSQTFYIREWTQQENNYYYSSWFPISFVAPCFEIETPTAGAITQTSATLSGLRSGYVVVLSDGTNTANYEVSGGTLSLTGLASATHYTAEVRSYCNQEKYSSKTVEFTTVGCYSPTNVKVTDITPLQAKVSWTQGNPHLSGLRFYYILEEKEINGTYTQVGDTVKGYSGISKTFTNLKPATEYRVSVAEQCGTDYGIPTKIPFTTSTPGNFVAISEGNWDNATTWQDGRIPNGIGTITINNGVTVTLDRTLVLTNNYTLTNNGTLLINKGELVNTTNNNNLGNVRISFTATQNKWKFIGAPFTSVQDSKYRLESIEPVLNSDVAVVLYDYPSGAWSGSWATINDRVPQAEGFFAWPFYNGTITFNNDYNTDNRVDYSLNNSDITVTRDVRTSSGGNWMALANPYPAELDIARFLSDNSEAGLQGGVTYNFNGSTFDVKNCTSGSLPVCEGFFVNFQSAGNDKSVVFHKTQMTSYPSENNTKSKTAQNPWIEMSLVNKIDKVKFFFVRNPLAEQGYDKYDANKLFATTGVAEPYFVTDGMNLVKEEVKELPYYATLNVRSEQDTLMTFVADKIPEGYRVSLIDGEQTIEMNEGSRYETNISAGENADRFKLLIQNNVGLNQVSQTDITITNSNRHVAISAEAISNVEVFNALGQRVYQTKTSTFTLSGVQSGVYVVRVSTAKGTKSQKIVVE